MAIDTAQVATTWFTKAPDAVAQELVVDPERGLSSAEAAERLARHGPNSLPEEPPPSLIKVALAQLADPMNVMLVAVAVASLVIGQTSTGILIGLLVLGNVALGANQEMKARASVAALEQLQVPTARVVRDGSRMSVEAADLVPGDVVTVEAGDLVPADGRIVVSATLEAQEAGLTGESAPVAKDAAALSDPETALGDRTNMLFQNTSVTRGTATLVVTATGAETQMGRIAGLLTSVKRSRSPLQRELTGVTKWLGVVAWAAVAVIFVIGLIRGLELESLVLLGITTAISAIPTGLPTFVQLMLSSGARRLADAKAVVKNLSDVETLGATSAINSDKTGTLTLNQMTATRVFGAGQWLVVQGTGYEKHGEILHDAGHDLPDLTPLGYALTLCSDATVSDDGVVVGDPTEAALVVLAAKIGVDAEISRRELPRLAEVPFDSAYKFMATFHQDPRREGTVIELAKGAPDVVLDRCASAWWGGEEIPIAEVRERIEAANAELGAKGLRVLSIATRRFPDSVLDEIRADPMAQVSELVFVALIGIIDPLRPEAKAAVTTALGAGIDVRMITGDHAVTAKAIADDLGLGPGVITGPEFQRLDDDELRERVPDLHVFGRVAPEDKLRLVASMQEAGQVVAMTGDAVNDAAALKKADIGVAMGSGSEVSKQSAKMILTDDNFATLVHAVELGRGIYAKITAYVRYQLMSLFGLLSLMLLATIFDVNSGIALTPGMLIFVGFVIALFPVLAMLHDEDDPGLMRRPPRDPARPILSRRTGPRWLLAGVVLGVTALIPLAFGPDEPSIDGPSASMTMAFGVTAFATLGLGLVARRDPEATWRAPQWPYVGWVAIGAVLTWFAVELPMFQRWLDTSSLSGREWLGVLGLALVTPVAVEISKAVRRAIERRGSAGA
jgi:Ca2+-transporting ATPase